MDTVQAPQRIFMLLPAHSLQFHLCKHDAANNWGHLFGMGTRFSVAEKVTWLNQNARPNQLMGCQNIQKTCFHRWDGEIISELCIFYKKSHHSEKPTLSPPRRWRWGPFFSGKPAGVKGTSPSRDIPADESSNELIAKPGSGNGGRSWGSAAVKWCMGDSPSNKLNHQDSANFSYLLLFVEVNPTHRVAVDRT